MATERGFFSVFLIMFAIIGAYFLLVCIAAWLFRKIALLIKNDKVVGRWAALIGVLTLLLPVFWDVPPTLIVHRYYCSIDAGEWVYKDPEIWKAEKDGKKPILEPIKIESKIEEQSSHKYSSAKLINLDLESFDENKFLSVYLSRWRLVDKHSREVLVEMRDYLAWNRLSDFRRPLFSVSGCGGGYFGLPSKYSKAIKKFSEVDRY